MTSAQQLLRSQRDLLLTWTRDHPAPLLRWLRDAEVISSTHYLSLLERSPSNAVAQALETVCATEESSQKFLQVLREVQDYYCTDLQVWVERHCRSDAAAKPEPAPVKVEGESVNMWRLYYYKHVHLKLSGKKTNLTYSKPAEQKTNRLYCLKYTGMGKLLTGYNSNVL